MTVTSLSEHLHSERIDAHSAMTETPGQMLKAARLYAGLTEEKIAEKLHLTVTHVQKLEADDYENHAGLTFEKGYLKLYARLMRLPEERILTAFDTLGIADHAHQKPIQPIFTRGTLAIPRRTHRSWWIVGLLCVLALIAVFFIESLAQTHNQTRDDTGTTVTLPNG